MAVPPPSVAPGDDNLDRLMTATPLGGGPSFLLNMEEDGERTARSGFEGGNEQLIRKLNSYLMQLLKVGLKCDCHFANRNNCAEIRPKTSHESIMILPFFIYTMLSSFFVYLVCI